MKRKMIQCASPVDKSAVSRTNIGGVEHIIVSSFTLPDDVVMNGGLYPAEEIAKSFQSLERTLAPVEHPQDPQGNFISASDPIAIHDFHAGAFNVNVSRENGRVNIQKHINVQEALKTERGKRLLDRINEIETNDKPRPIHTSVGVFLSVEELGKPQTNAAGDEFTWIARDMFFDHDAILLDSVGAATPDNGVGMAVNADGDKVDVEVITVASEEDKNGFSDQAKKSLTAILEVLSVNAEGVSFNSVMEQLQTNIQGIVAADWIFLVDVFEEEVIFETSQGFFSVQWNMSQGKANISGIPIRVDRTVTYQPKVNRKGGAMNRKEMIVSELAALGIHINGALADRLNNLLESRSDDDDERSDLIDRMASAAGIDRGTVLQILRGDIETPPEDRLRGFAEVLGVSLESLKNLVDNSGGDTMKEMVLNALAGAGVETDGMSDEQLMEEYGKLQGNTQDEVIANAVKEAVKPLTDQIADLTTKVNASDDQEHKSLAKIVGNSDKFPGLDEEAASLLPVEKLKEMAANCGSGFGVGLTFEGNSEEALYTATEVPE